MHYGLPTLFHRVELAFVQQSKKHTYQFTGSQRECSFVLMGSHLSKFLVIKSFVFRAVPDDASGGLDHVIPQIAVSSLVHGCVLSFKVAGLVFLPDNAAIFGKCIIVFKTFDSADFSKNATGINLADSGNRVEDLLLGRIQPFHRS